MKLLIEEIPYLIGTIFLSALVLAYKDWKKFKRIEKLNELYKRAAECK
jgi:hypothetical protein